MSHSKKSENLSLNYIVTSKLKNSNITKLHRYNAIMENIVEDSQVPDLDMINSDEVCPIMSATT